MKPNINFPTSSEQQKPQDMVKVQGKKMVRKISQPESLNQQNRCDLNQQAHSFSALNAQNGREGGRQQKNSLIDAYHISYNKKLSTQTQLNGKNYFTCLSCKKQFQTKLKRSFNCLHYFCSKCMEKYYLKTIQTGAKFSCPVSSCKNQRSRKNARLQSLLNKDEQIEDERDRKQFKSKRSIQLDDIHLITKQQNKYSRKSLQLKIQRQQSIGKMAPHYRSNSQNYQKYICKVCLAQLKETKNDKKIICECGAMYCSNCKQVWVNKEHICILTKEFRLSRLQQNSQDSKKVKLENKVQNFTCIRIVKFVFFGFIWILLIIFFFFPKFIIGGIITFIASLLAGVTYFACGFVCGQDKIYKKILLIIFYPFAILVGIGMALINFFSLFYQNEVKLFQKATKFLID